MLLYYVELVGLGLRLSLATQLNYTSSDVRYVSKYRDTPGVSGYDTAMLVYRYFYNLTIEAVNLPVL